MKYSNPQKVIHLLERHRQEFREFTAKAIEDRHLLARKHREEKSQLSVYPYKQIQLQLAIVIERQTTEIMNHGSFAQRQRVALKIKHTQELADLATF